MRTVSFSHPPTQKLLNDEFVCTTTSTEGTDAAGASLKHSPQDQPGTCGRGAGRQNVQVVFLTPQNELFHVVTGFLDGPSLLEEAQFAAALYKSLARSPKQRREAVVNGHGNRLLKLGFSRQEIQSPSRFGDQLATTFSPKDLGIDTNFGGLSRGNGSQLGGRSGGNLFDAMARQRVLKDHRFMIQQPLVDRDKFDVAPQDLVGHGKSFFGTTSAFSGFPQQGR